MKRLTIALLAFSLFGFPVMAQTPGQDEENHDQQHWPNDHKDQQQGDQNGEHKHHHHHHKDDNGGNGNGDHNGGQGQ